MPLGFSPEVPNDKREGSQHDVADKGQGEEYAGPVCRGSEKQREGKPVQTGVVVRLERSESLRAQEEQQKVHHRNYDIVSDQEDVIQGPHHEDRRDGHPEALEPQGEAGMGLPDEGEGQREGRPELC